MAEEEDKHFKDVMNRLAESSSLHGIPKIVTSRQIVVKILWCLLLIGAVVLFTLQFRGLTREYFSYPTKTSVTLQFASLPFPAVTFCNMNPIKMSNAASSGKYSNISNLLNDLQLNEYVESNNDDFSRLLDDLYLSDYREFNSSRDEYIAWKIRLMIEISKLQEADRREAGHQLIDFIHSVTFAGDRLPLGMFKTSSSPKYGNCFTIDNEGIIARGSGNSNSLHVVFNIDKGEYLHDFSSAYGVRMVLHETDTHPLADEEGVTLSNKYETHVGIRMTKMSRLGGKYGKCTNGESFTKHYGTRYTVPICYAVCEAENIFGSCGCIPMTSKLVSEVPARICDIDNSTEWTCVDRIIDSIHDGVLTCDCQIRCNQNMYSPTLSGRVWPHLIYAKQVLIKETCRRLNDSTHNYTMSFKFQNACRNTTDLDELPRELIDDLTENFLSVYIYYEDLNHAVISEEPLYNTERFLSDIGGALGLYVGASFLTCVELLQVILEVVLHLKNKKKNKVVQMKSSSRDLNVHA